MEKSNQEIVAQKIRTQYVEKEQTQLDELQELNRKVKRPVDVFAYIFGSVSAVIMGSGMSLVMTDISKNLGMEDAMVYGIIIGVIGLALAIVNYPIYKKILKVRRAKYAGEIIALSDKIIKSEK